MSKNNEQFWSRVVLVLVVSIFVGYYLTSAWRDFSTCRALGYSLLKCLD